MSLQQIMFVAGISCLVASLAFAAEAVRFYVAHNVRGVRNDLLGRMRLDSSHGPMACEPPTEVLADSAMDNAKGNAGRHKRIARSTGVLEGDRAHVADTVDYRAERETSFVVEQCVLSYSKGDVLDIWKEAL